MNNQKSPRAIILLSGGLDSATTLYLARRDGYNCHCLIFDYGQRHRREIASAKRIALKAGSTFEVVKIRLPWKGSSLLDKKLKIRQLNKLNELSNSIPSTYVPARNIIFLSFALSCAEAKGAEAIFIGANAIDYSGYPDCRPEFYNEFRKAANAGTKSGVEGLGINIMVPLIDKTKAEIVRLGMELGVPHELTWSCYKGGGRPCGKCDSCRIREKGFEDALNHSLRSGSGQAHDIANIHEIFVSIQGEGIFSGKRQVFVRFFGCNLKCVYCDTAQKPNEILWYSKDELFSAVSIKAAPESVHSVSLTGGEPLLQADFLKDFLPKLKQAGYKIYLETNGTMPQELAKIIDFVDIVAMDIKLPSSTGNAGLWRQNLEFLKIAMTRQVFVKIVVTGRTTAADLNKAVSLIAEQDPHIALVLQPVTPQPDVKAINPEMLERFNSIASEHLRIVKVIPQMHKLYGVK